MTCKTQHSDLVRTYRRAEFITYLALLLIIIGLLAGILGRTKARYA